MVEKLGLLIELLGTWFICKSLLYQKWLNKSIFRLWPENEMLFRPIDKIVLKIGSILLWNVFKKNKNNENLSENIRNLRSGNNVIIGFVFVLIGVIIQLLCRKIKL